MRGLVAVVLMAALACSRRSEETATAPATATATAPETETGTGTGTASGTEDAAASVFRASGNALVIAATGNPVIEVDVRVLDALEVMHRDRLLLGIGDVEVELQVDRPGGAAALVRALAARRRETGDPGSFLRIGGRPVTVAGETVEVRGERFEVADVRARAMNGDNLVLAGGAKIQAALVLLAIAARDR